jgi:hypothetical protein
MESAILARLEAMASAPEQDPIDLSRLAEVMAHLRQFPTDDRADVLARLGLDEPAWEAALTRWSAARDAELERGATEITRRFGAAFARARKRLEATRPALESLGRLPDPPVAPSPAPSAPPHAPSAPPPAPVAVTPPAMVSPASRLSSTLPLGAELPVAALPFAPGPGAFEAAVARLRRPHPNPSPGTGSERRGAESGEEPGIPGAPPAAVQAPRREPSILGGTVAVSSAAPSPALPFRVEQGATVGLPAGASAEPAVPPGVPDLTLPQYASLRVELHLSPDRAEAILARYGVTGEARAPLDAHWRARFEADPLLRMMFARAYATYTAWLRSNPAP